jgi:hypothetical protein
MPHLPAVLATFAVFAALALPFIVQAYTRR